MLKQIQYIFTLTIILISIPVKAEFQPAQKYTWFNDDLGTCTYYIANYPNYPKYDTPLAACQGRKAQILSAPLRAPSSICGSTTYSCIPASGYEDPDYKAFLIPKQNSCPSNSFYNPIGAGACACNSGYEETGTGSCVSSCTASQVRINGVCQEKLTCNTLTHTYDAPTNTCIAKTCPNLGGQIVTSQFCKNWTETIGSCKYKVKNVTQKCTTKNVDVHGNTIPLASCIYEGQLFEGTVGSPISLMACEFPAAGGPDDEFKKPFKIELQPLSDEEKARRAAERAGEKAKEELKAAQEKAKREAERVAQENAENARKQQKAVEQENQRKAEQAAAEAAATAAENAKQAAQNELQNANNETPQNPTRQQNAQNALNQATQAAQQAATAATNAAKAAQAATQLRQQIQAGGSSVPPSGAQSQNTQVNVGGGSCGDLACETTLQQVAINTKQTAELLGGEGTSMTEAIGSMDEDIEAFSDGMMAKVLNAYNGLNISKSINDSFSEVLPQSPFEKISQSTQKECVLKFYLYNKEYKLDMCPSLPYLHPAVSFILMFALAIFILSVIFERPKG